MSHLKRRVSPLFCHSPLNSAVKRFLKKKKIKGKLLKKFSLKPFQNFSLRAAERAHPRLRSAALMGKDIWKWLQRNSVHGG